MARMAIRYISYLPHPSLLLYNIFNLPISRNPVAILYRFLKRISYAMVPLEYLCSLCLFCDHWTQLNGN